MTSAPKGLSKAAEENTIAADNLTEEAQKRKAEDVSPTNTDAKVKAQGGSRDEDSPLPKAEPESVGQPGDEQKPAQEDKPTPTGQRRRKDDPAKEGPAVFEVPPAVAGPNEPVEEGKVEVTRPAQAGELSDPSGNVTKREKAAAKVSTPKSDPLAKVDTSKLPVSVGIGNMVLSVEEYAGNAVLSISLKGWVGDAPVKIRADETKDLEKALAELRKQLK